MNVGCMNGGFVVQMEVAMQANQLNQKNPYDCLKIRNERDLIDELNLTPTEAAAVLGKTRQSLNQANLNERDNYFKKGELFSLIMHSKSQNAEVDLSHVFEYLNASRGSSETEELRSTNFTQPVDQNAIMECDDLWVIIPDYLYLRAHHAEVYEFLIGLGRRNGVKPIFFVSNQQERTILEKACNVNDTRIKVVPKINALPYMIIAKPRSIADCFILLGSTYVKHNWAGGLKLANLVDELVEDASEEG